MQIYVAVLLTVHLLATVQHMSKERDNGFQTLGGWIVALALIPAVVWSWVQVFT